MTSSTPFGAGITLGNWTGIPVRAHWSAFLALGLFAYVFAEVDLPGLRPGLSPVAYWSAGLITALAFFATLLLHELAHAILGRHYGQRARRISLWMLGGMTELEDEPPSPRADALVAAVGPLTSLLLAAIFAAAAWLLGDTGIVAAACVWLAVINVVLGVFNLLPGAPLDGGRVLRAIIWWRTHDRALSATRAATAGRYLGMALIGLGMISLLVGGWSGLWLALVGWFIATASSSERYAVAGEKLHGLRVRDAMTPVAHETPDWWTPAQLIDGLGKPGTAPTLYAHTDIHGRYSGSVTLESLLSLRQAQRTSVHLREFALPPNRAILCGPEDELSRLLLPLHQRKQVAIVLEAGHPIGFVTDESLTMAAARPSPSVTTPAASPASGATDPIGHDTERV